MKASDFSEMHEKNNLYFLYCATKAAKRRMNNRQEAQLSLTYRPTLEAQLFVLCYQELLSGE